MNLNDFTNLFELQKTLRFELKPLEKTKELLRQEKILQKDEKRKENYDKIKIYFDKIHRKFVKESLENADLDFKNFKKIYDKFLDDKSNQKYLNKEEKKLRKEIVKLFDQNAKKWKENYKEIKISKNNHGFLFEKEILDIMKKEFSDDEDIIIKDIQGSNINLFDYFKGFTTYFTNFNNSRKNFYKDDGTSTAIATRIIDVNLKKFCKNINKLKKIQDISLNDNEKNIFNIDFHNKCFLQQGIDEYNEIIGGINLKINLFNQKDKKNKIPNLEILYKQILGEKDLKNDFKEVNNNDEVFGFLQNFYDENITLIDVVDEFRKNVLENVNNFNLEKIYIPKKILNEISRKFFNSWSTLETLLLEYVYNGKRKDIPDFIPLSTFKHVFESNKVLSLKSANLFDKELNYFENFINFFKKEFAENIKNYNDNSEKLLEMIKNDKKYTNKKQKIKVKKDNKEKEVEIEIQKKIIKEFCDSSLEIFRIMKYFLPDKKGVRFTELEEDNNFYDYIDDFFYGNNRHTDCNIFKNYNAVRNYLTRKPFSTDKIKLNFENGQLLSGWDLNKETDCFGVVLYVRIASVVYNSVG